MDPMVVIGAIGTIITTVVGAGVKGVWVWGWTYKDKVKDCSDVADDRDFWRDIALGLLRHNEAIAAKVVKDE